MDTKIILITGAGGLLGGHILDVLHEKFELHAIVHRLPSRCLRSVTYHTLDLAVGWSTVRLPRRVDVIIHLAQSSRFRDFPNSALDVFRVNIESTVKLLDYAKLSGVSLFVYASSGGVYGKGGLAFTESSPIAPPGQLGYYLGSKMCSEILAQSYASLMHIVVLRPFFMYGPGQNRSMLMPRLMDNVAAGRPIVLLGDNGIRINPLHVEDAAAAVIAALSLNQSATFNIAGPSVLSIRDICAGMGSYLGCQPVFEIQTGDPEDLIGNTAAMCEQLVSPQRHLLDHLADVLN